MRLGRIILYVRDVDVSAAFYVRHFGFHRSTRDGDRIVELGGPDGGATILLHKAGKAQKMGQVLVKLVFDVENVEETSATCAGNGLAFGPLHHGEGYVRKARKHCKDDALKSRDA